MQNKSKKIFIVIAALIVGFLMPYLSRIPLAFTYGAAWIWKFMPNFDSVRVWNEFHLISLEPMLMFGIVYIFGNVKWTFYTAAVAHFAVTFLCYYNFEETPQRDDFLSFLVFPFIIAAPSFLCGAVALVAELIAKRNARVQTPLESEKVYE